jgi:hypothetical protein
MHIACWIHKTTNTHSEYVIFIAFTRKKRLRESASVLRYKYTACLVQIFSKRDPEDWSNGVFPVKIRVFKAFSNNPVPFKHLYIPYASIRFPLQEFVTQTWRARFGSSWPCHWSSSFCSDCSWAARVLDTKKTKHVATFGAINKH